MSVLYLIPTPISGNAFKDVFSKQVIDVIHSLQQFIVEDIRTARRFLSKVAHPEKIESLKFQELNEHTGETEFSSLLPYILAANTGVISEAGVPCVADPGAQIVRLAHANSISVIPLIGPSSILMALMASGLNGQSFSFVGYLPVKKNERMERLRVLERRSISEKQTQIFIETPYRNMQLLDDIINSCRRDTLLTIASGITSKDEYILTQTIQQWKMKLPFLNKIPTVFLLQANF